MRFDADLVHLNAKAMFKPLRHQVSMTVCFARVTVGCGFPTEHHRTIAEAEELIVDFCGSSRSRISPYSSMYRAGIHGTKPIAGL